MSRITVLPALLLATAMGCAQSTQAPEVVESTAETAASVVASVAATNASALADVLAAQPADAQARYGARHPQETLTFFGIEPGMTVAEALPGGGWYTRILTNYLGGDGRIYGVNYQDSVWKSFGWSEERIQGQVAATAKFAGQVGEWTDNGISAEGFTFATVPESAAGTADAVLFIRALHNLNRFKDTGVLDEAVAAAHTLLKPGGIVGVVQHRAPETAPDEWATGRAGYLKPSYVIEVFTSAGFELDGSSEVNANPNDKPTADDIVWRLPPTYALGEDSKTAMDAIGESDRMTLRFKKVG